MKVKYNLVYLSDEFYYKYNTEKFPEIEHKKERPYLVMLVKINENTFAIPFRTNVKHRFCYKFKNSSRNTYSSTGLDYSKAVIVNDENFIGANAFIDNKEYVELNNKYFFIIKQFTQYVDGYIKVMNGNGNKFDLLKYKYSTLKYFHSELGLEKNQHQKTFTYSRKQLQESADKISQDKPQNKNRLHEKEELKI